MNLLLDSIVPLDSDILDECVPVCLAGMEKGRQEIKQILIRCENTAVRNSWFEMRISRKCLGTETSWLSQSLLT